MTPRRKVTLVFLIALALLAFVPRNVTIAPEWTVTVRDENGKPMVGACVVQWWQHYSVEAENHEASGLTDENGRVRFPARLLTVVWAVHFIGAISNFRETGVHASFGPHSHVAAYKTGFGEMNFGVDRENTSWNGFWDRPQLSKFILRQCPAGKSGLGCVIDVKWEKYDSCSPDGLKHTQE